jgi:hypothetical protein
MYRCLNNVGVSLIATPHKWVVLHKDTRVWFYVSYTYDEEDHIVLGYCGVTTQGEIEGDNLGFWDYNFVEGSLHLSRINMRYACIVHISIFNKLNNQYSYLIKKIMHIYS